MYGSLDVVFDAVGGPYSEPALRGLGWGGRFVVIGFAAGGENPKAAIPSIPLNLPLLNERRILGCFWGAWKAMDGNRGNRRNVEAMMELLRRGEMPAPLTSRPGELRLGDYAEAFQRMARRAAIGKVCVTVKEQQQQGGGGGGGGGSGEAAALLLPTSMASKL